VGQSLSGARRVDTDRPAAWRPQMSRIDILYRWLARVTDPAVEEILAAGLTHAEPEYAARIAELLLNRRHDATPGALVAHYDRLPEELRQRIRRRTELVRAGIAIAIHYPDSRARQNALLLLREVPCPPLAYLAADALRDSSGLVREAAAQALCRLADYALTAEPAERAEVAAALLTALRTFEAHGRQDILEPCLWFAREHGEALWQILGDPRARARQVIFDRLREWNSPRLAGFLLLALAQTAWRETARQLLEGWAEAAHVVALLSHTDLLPQPEVRRGLRLLRRPAWAASADRMLETLSPRQRAQLPHWICRLGFDAFERLRYLERCLDAPWPEVQRAACQALAALNDEQAVRVLVRVATRRTAGSVFARWYVAGRRLLQQGDRPSAVRTSSPIPTVWTPC